MQDMKLKMQKEDVIIGDFEIFLDVFHYHFGLLAKHILRNIFSFAFYL